MPFDPYAVLGVARDATPEQIKLEYRQLCLIHHPDKGGDPELMARINRAYEILSSPESRAKFDAGGDPEDSAEREVFFDEILAAHTNATNDLCDRLAKAHAELDNIRTALGIESGMPILPAIQEKLESLRFYKDATETPGLAASTLTALLERCEKAESDAINYRARMVELERSVEQLELEDGLLKFYRTNEAPKESQARVVDLESQLHALRLVAGTSDANRFETTLDRAQARVAELEATCENLRETVCADADKILTLEAREARLRKALERIRGNDPEENRQHADCIANGALEANAPATSHDHCLACGKPWVEHDGISRTCAKLAEANEAISDEAEISAALRKELKAARIDAANAERAEERMRAELMRARYALEMIAGRRQCVDSLMSDKDIARSALAGSAQPSADEGGKEGAK